METRHGKENGKRKPTEETKMQVSSRGNLPEWKEHVKEKVGEEQVEKKIAAYKGKKKRKENIKTTVIFYVYAATLV